MADDLFCCERLQPEHLKAERDPVIFSDRRVLMNLLHLEKQYQPTTCYFTHVQKDIKPFMRQVVCTWMLEVCEELGAEDQILPLSVNLLDRFLGCCQIHKRHLQLAASVCIVVASKVRQCQYIRPETLCYYADHSITPRDIKDWELLLLSKLQWNLTGVTAHDFVDHIIDRLGMSDHRLVRQHAVTLVGVCATDPSFLLAKPSVIAAACIASAARGLRTPLSSSAVPSICALLSGTTTPEIVEPYIVRIEAALQAETSFGRPVHQHTPTKRPSIDAHPHTPTDVSDIHF